MEVLIVTGLLFIGVVGMERFLGESYRPRWSARRERPSGEVIFLTHGPVQK